MSYCNKLSSFGIPKWDYQFVVPKDTAGETFCLGLQFKKEDCVIADSTLMRSSVSFLVFGGTKNSMSPANTEPTVSGTFYITVGCFLTLTHRFPICHFFWLDFWICLFFMLILWFVFSCWSVVRLYRMGNKSLNFSMWKFFRHLLSRAVFEWLEIFAAATVSYVE